MLRFIIRRLALAIPTLFGITFLVFALISLAPGGAVPSWVSADASASGVVRRGLINDRLGLDDPLFVQYGRWLGRVSPVNFGARPLVDPATGAVVPPVRALPGVPMLEPRNIADASSLDPDRAEPAYRAAKLELYTAREAYILEPNEQGKRRWQAARALALAYEGQLDWDRAGASVIPGVLWIGAPDLGVSWARSRPISSLLGDALPITLGINALAAVLIYLIAIPLGVWSASKEGKPIDRFISGALLAMWSLPIVWVATLAISLLSSSSALRVFPTGGLHSPGSEDMVFLPGISGGVFEPGYLLDALWHVALPVFCLVLTGLAMLARQTRAAIIQTMRERYITSARAKGVPEGRVLFEHGLRTSLLPIITLFTALLPALLAGSLVIETVFSIPGIGLLTVEAINMRDRELMLAITLVVSVVNLLAMILADVLYAMADPRVRESVRESARGEGRA